MGLIDISGLGYIRYHHHPSMLYNGKNENLMRLHLINENGGHMFSTAGGARERHEDSREGERGYDL